MRKKVFFASDFHLGNASEKVNAERERCIIRWLDSIADEAHEIYLVGDLFDFWYEYKSVVPRGYVRLMGKLAALRDRGIPIYFFTGNHDMWMFDYFEKEMDIPVYKEPIEREILGKQFYIGHGDGLGPGDYGYKFIKKVFANPVCQWLFARLHPNFGFALARFWSGKSREANPRLEAWRGEANEWLLTYSNAQLDSSPADFFVFGHRHLPIDYKLKNGSSRYINLGEWMNFNSYAEFDGESMVIKFFEKEPYDYPRNS